MATTDAGPTVHLPDWVNLEITHITLALLVFGLYLCTVNQLSYYLREKLLLSSSLISFGVGIAAGPIGLDWISPWQWTNFDDSARNNLTFQITRLVIGIQVMFAGIDLPAAYLRREALSLFMLLIPVMTVAWFVSAGFILLFIPSLSFLEALCIAACVTPTDPILANAIVKGRYAEKHVPKSVRDIISAESGANDGLGYPFLFLPIYLMERPASGEISDSLRHWVVTTWLYQIFLACAVGAIIGFVARKTLKEAHRRQLIDHESFLAYGIGLAFLTLGVVGVLGSDDVLACFIAGNSLTWSDHYRIETEDEPFQDVIDSLLNTSVFIYLGSIMPWSELNNAYLTPWKLFLLAACILAFRRLPFLLAIHKLIPALPSMKQGIFAGWFGPIGVSAVYYAILALHSLPEDRIVLRTVIVPVVLLMAMCSTIVHGITIPLTRVAPVAMTRTRSTMSAASQHLSATGLWTYFRAPVTRPSPTATRTGFVFNIHASATSTQNNSRAASRRNSFESPPQSNTTSAKEPVAEDITVIAEPAEELIVEGNSTPVREWGAAKGEPRLDSDVEMRRLEETAEEGERNSVSTGSRVEFALPPMRA
ncbi:hypothetical protein JCM1840_006952 [Sporobolomyces johnsonii]